ncbi:O-antigen ligase family protein [Muriicola jejuensis]|uniref:O-antigen ligase family protein n=2 Tax=Muriicola jejuensis TaxID=504488 RepID=UPI00293BAD21|nr:O-antigen ligase family protein [Muriicola jejuensis]
MEMFKLRHLDSLIVTILFASLPVDMINGILLKSNNVLPVSIGQIFKTLVLILIFVRFLFSVKYLIISIFLFFLLLIPSFYQLVINSENSSFLFDIVKVSRYLLPLFSLLFFIPIIRRKDQSIIRMLFNLVKFSYIILVGNILLKLFGLGYPMYEEGNIGSKGYFFAGNEISVLLIILASIIAFDLWLRKRRGLYILFLILNIMVGVMVSSKTGLIGIGLIFLLIPIKKPTRKFGLKKLKGVIITSIIALPLGLLVTWRIIKNSPIFDRFSFFWDKLDFWTFVLSSRNKFFGRAYENYKENYNLIEKFIGVGQSKYEALNQGKIVEMDVADIFFAYGIFGLILFLFLTYVLWIQLLRLRRYSAFYFANFVFLMVLVLLSISTMAGHVFSSGMAGIFIGLLISLMYLKLDDKTSK